MLKTAKKKAVAPKQRRVSTDRKHLLPYETFPLFAHANGKWAKKIRVGDDSRLYYFGRWDAEGDTKWEAALKLYERQIPDILAGRERRKPSADGASLKILVNRFLAAKRSLVESGELGMRSFSDYHKSCKRLLAILGEHAPVADIDTSDFERLRARLAKTRGPVALGNEITRIRSVFKYAYDCNPPMLQQPMRYGQSFDRPGERVVRHQKNLQGERMIEAADLRRLIKKAHPNLRAFILLGLNCGFSNDDCGKLPFSALDLDGGWITFPRPKTAIKRRCPLWPETMQAIRATLAKRPAPRHADDAELVFLTPYGAGFVKRRGMRFETAEVDGRQITDVKGTSGNPISDAMRNLLKAEGLYRRGQSSFYTLRHITQTIGEDGGDVVAVKHIMGHVDKSMSGTYRERISDDRLLAVTNRIREWLLSEGRGPKEKKPRGGWRLTDD